MSSTVSGSDSDADPIAIPPTALTSNSNSNSNIDITAQPAVITWRTPDGEDRCLTHLNFDLHYDIRSSKAFFKLRASVALKSHPRSRNTPIFLFIHPERIRALVLDDSPYAAEARMLGFDIVCLHFALSRLPALVVPKESLAPRNQTSGKMLDSLRELIQQATFSINVQIPCRRLPRQRLLALCDAASRSELRSIANHSNASTLYAGSGGEIIEGDSLFRPDNTASSEGHESAIEPSMENPPSYDEVPPGPPPVVPGPHKRRRLSTPGSEPAPLELLD